MNNRVQNILQFTISSVELKIMMEVLFFPSLPQDHPQVEGAAGSWW